MSFESPHAAEKNPRERFMDGCKRTLDKLVSEEVIPAWFAKERLESAEHIEQSLSENPEQDGIDFARVGIARILQFHEGLDQRKESVLAEIDLLITKHKLWASQAYRPEIREKMLTTVSRLELAREHFLADVEKTKNFEQ